MNLEAELGLFLSILVQDLALGRSVWFASQSDFNLRSRRVITKPSLLTCLLPVPEFHVTRLEVRPPPGCLDQQAAQPEPSLPVGERKQTTAAWIIRRLERTTHSVLI